MLCLYIIGSASLITIAPATNSFDCSSLPIFSSTTQETAQCICLLTLIVSLSSSIMIFILLLSIVFLIHFLRITSPLLIFFSLSAYLLFTSRTRLRGIQKKMAAYRRFMFFFCGRGKVGGSNNRLLRDESFELCLTEQRCSVPCVTFFFLIFRPLGC